jgi:hypothetical protein
MAEPNGNQDWSQRLSRLEGIAQSLLESARLNVDEHEKIWKGIDALRQVQLETNQGVTNLVGAIRDLIDRIPPENLR